MTESVRRTGAPVASSLTRVGTLKDAGVIGSHESRLLGIVGDNAGAVQAKGIFKIEPVLALRTLKQLHRGSSRSQSRALTRLWRPRVVDLIMPPAVTGLSAEGSTVAFFTPSSAVGTRDHDLGCMTGPGRPRPAEAVGPFFIKVGSVNWNAKSHCDLSCATGKSHVSQT